MPLNPMYEPRFYRDWVERSGLATFHVHCRESDLLIRARRPLPRQAEKLLVAARRHIETAIARTPALAHSLSPIPPPPGAPPIVLEMVRAAQAFGVGPMAAVAGAVAQFVGQGLLQWSPDVIVENGGDIFMKLDRPAEIGLYAGEHSPFSGTIHLRIAPDGAPRGVCTSSGTVGHSLSFGRADAVVALADSAPRADAAATAVANRVASPDDLEKTLNRENARGLLQGLLIVCGERIGAFGQIEIVAH